MILVTAAITMLVALACGGRIRDLNRLDINHVWLFPLTVVFLAALDWGKARGWVGPALTPWVQPIIYLIVMLALYLNRQIRGALVLAAGTFLNFLVITVNGGYMPVSVKALSAAGLGMKDIADVMYLRHAPMTAPMRLGFLGDVIPVPWPPLLRCVGSAGDLVVLVGMVYLVWKLFFPGREAAVVSSAAPGTVPESVPER